MKNKFLKYFLFSVIALWVSGVAVVLLYVTWTNQISKINAAARQAREAYNEAKYPTAFITLKHMEDDFSVKDDALKLNLAHTAFHMSKSTADSSLVSNALKNTSAGDSADVKTTLASLLANYNELGQSAPEHTIASIANNQLGVIAAHANAGNQQDSEVNLEEAAANFKAALKKDPLNETARFNYELTLKKIEYPKVLMNAIKSLVAQRKYKEAHATLKAAADRDSHIAKLHQDYLKRLETIISIDYE